MSENRRRVAGEEGNLALLPREKVSLLVFSENGYFPGEEEQDFRLQDQLSFDSLSILIRSSLNSAERF